MGLDCIWKLPESCPQHPEFEPPLQLCGGMLSGNGRRSFRGKVYNDFFNEILDESLYVDLLPEDVKRIAAKLEALPDNTTHNLGIPCSYEVTNKDFHDLRRMFRAYAQCGADLFAWY